MYDYIEKASLALLSFLFIVFPVFFVNLTTDFFNLPKQALLVFIMLVILLLYAVKTLLMEKVGLRRTPFDAPVLIFILALLLSSIFSVAKFDSLANFIPVLFAAVSFFAITNNAKNERSIMVLSSSLLLGGVLLSLITILSYLKVYIFPFDFTKSQLFTPAGSFLDQALYLLFVVPIGLYFLTPFVFAKGKMQEIVGKANDLAKLAGFSAATIIITAGIFTSVYILVKQNAFNVLPISFGFQTSFAAISQDSGRIVQSMLFGTGFGEFFIDFTKYKLASFNANPSWNITFLHSSSFVLELLATTGLAGFLSFLFLCYKIVRERPLFVPLVVVIAVCFVLPVTFYSLTLLFFLLGIYAGLRGLKNDSKYFDVELQLVALKKGIFSLSPEESTHRKNSRTLSYLVFALIAVLVIGLGFVSFDYVLANVNFENSLVSANQNNGQATYNYQNESLSSFSGRFVDSYYRIFSQTNLALANTLASSVPQGSSPSAQTTQTIYTLVQQSINSARQATIVSPQNTLNWQNLSGIYRALIGFGQNADSFAVQAQQQATLLDPTNPQEYIALGGIYYQLGDWNNAQAQFQQAVNLKQDYANAYYNLGHALQQKGDLQGALAQYQTVKSLVAGNADNTKLIDEEISAIQSQIGQQANQQQAPAVGPQQSAPLQVPQTETLPTQSPKVEIPGPSGTPTPTPTPAENTGQTPTPTP